VSQASNDAEQDTTAGTVDLSSSDLELPSCETSTICASPFTDMVGIRFFLDVPQGANIEKAFLTFTTDEVTEGATSATIHAHWRTNSPVFTDTAFDLSSRKKSQSKVTWEPGPWTTKEEAHDSPDISELVESIVRRRRWTPGKAISLLFTGTGRRTAYSYDKDPSKAAKLTVVWSQKEPPATAAHSTTSATSVVIQGEWSEQGDDPADQWSTADAMAWGLELVCAGRSKDEFVAVVVATTKGKTIEYTTDTAEAAYETYCATTAASSPKTTTTKVTVDGSVRASCDVGLSLVAVGAAVVASFFG
jgi:hypothetical protein